VEGGPHRFPRKVHVGHRFQENDPLPHHQTASGQSLPPVLPHGNLPPLRQAVDHPKAHIVPRRRILFPGISQSDDQFHQRRAALKARPFLLPPRFRVARKSGGKASPPPISTPMKKSKAQPKLRPRPIKNRSEEHTSELQSR